MGQKNLFEQTRTRGELEELAVAKNESEEYWITVAGTGKPFVRESFATPRFCWECAVEIEENFDIWQVIELRLPETMERERAGLGGEWVMKGQQKETTDVNMLILIQR